MKQASRQWYKKFESFMGTQDYDKMTSDHSVFFKHFVKNDYIILLLYVDDMLLVGCDAAIIADLKRQLSKTFFMKDPGAARRFLRWKSAERKGP